MDSAVTDWMTGWNQWIQTGVDIPPPQLTDLPAEILMMILAPLKFKDLLKCRLINQQFKAITSAVSRRRLTAIRRSYTGRRSSSVTTPNVFTIFTDIDNLPWTSVNLSPHFFKDWRARKKFMAVFGSHLLKLGLCAHKQYGSILPVLRKTPNLISLELELNLKQDWRAPKRRKLTDSHLINLRELKVDINSDGGVGCLDFILKDSAVKLGRIRLAANHQFWAKLTSDSVDKLAVIYKAVQSLSLHLHHQDSDSSREMFATFGANNLRIQELDLYVVEPSSNSNGTCFDALETLLAGQNNYLESMTLSCEVKSGKTKAPLKFPLLSMLKTLHLHFICEIHRLHDEDDEDNELDWGNSWNENIFSESFFSQVKTNQFPSLEVVQIEMRNEWDDMGGYWNEPKPRATISFFTLCPKTSFDSVSELIADEWEFKDDWSRVFPNLKKLKTTTLNRENSLEAVFRNVNLEQLDWTLLDVNVDSDSDYSPEGEYLLDVDWFLAGSGEVSPKKLCKKSEEEIAKSAGSPFLKLTCLSVLTLTFEDFFVERDQNRTYNRLSDAGAQLSLLRMQPLESLTLINSRISAECQSQLNLKHKVCVFKTD